MQRAAPRQLLQRLPIVPICTAILVAAVSQAARDTLLGNRPSKYYLGKHYATDPRDTKWYFSVQKPWQLRCSSNHLSPFPTATDCRPQHARANFLSISLPLQYNVCANSERPDLPDLPSVYFEPASAVVPSLSFVLDVKGVCLAGIIIICRARSPMQ